jgi:hypothetical protein
LLAPVQVILSEEQHGTLTKFFVWSG